MINNFKEFDVDYTTEIVNKSMSVDARECNSISFEIEDPDALGIDINLRVNQLPLKNKIREFNNHPGRVIKNNFALVNAGNINIIIVRTYYSKI